jgi:hypothetical protein
MVPADGFSGEETLGVKSLALTVFQPGDPIVQPTDPDSAYLVVTGIDTSDPNPPPGYPSGSHLVDGFTALPAAALNLTLPDGTSVPATHYGSTENNLLDGVYFFTVPGDLTSATLTVNPGTVTGDEVPVFTGDTAMITFTQPATFTLSRRPLGIGLEYAGELPAALGDSPCGARRAPGRCWRPGHQEATTLDPTMDQETRSRDPPPAQSDRPGLHRGAQAAARPAAR